MLCNKPSGQSAVPDFLLEWQLLSYLQFIYEYRYWEERIVLSVAVHDMM